MPQTANVFLVDDDEALRESITTLLTYYGYPVRAFPSAQAFLEATAADAAGCLILDLHMPGMNGLALQHELLQHGYGLPVIFLSGLADIRSSVNAMKGGAIDFLEKPVAADRLVAQVRRGLAEDRRRRVARDKLQSIRSRFATLSPREREVMSLLARGTSNRDIASTLGISPRTVEHHREAVMRKMRVDSFAALCKLEPICRQTNDG